MNTTLHRAGSSSRVGLLVACVALLAIAAALAWVSLALPERAALRAIDGVVTRVSDASSSWKGVPVTQEEIAVRTGTHELYLRHEYLPQLQGIKPGDAVYVLAEPDVRGFLRIWELRKENLLLLSYEQSLATQERSNRLPLAIAAALSLAALALAARYARSRFVSRPHAA